ncbi:hypothetical protein V6N11_048095 [Hibiscus sabdariffa]|uniref:Uncharacterized protein n=2 Tax=Hibiscus sabdariffa TaxID=183260 RepID=A0ABR2NRM1_9ROSI
MGSQYDPGSHSVGLTIRAYTNGLADNPTPSLTPLGAARVSKTLACQRNKAQSFPDAAHPTTTRTTQPWPKHSQRKRKEGNKANSGLPIPRYKEITVARGNTNGSDGGAHEQRPESEGRWLGLGREM